MPELPEVETVARGLHSQLAGRRLRGIEIHDSKLRHTDYSPLHGASLTSAQRIGKRVAITFNTKHGPRWLLVHLRMSGVLFYTPDGRLPEGKPDKHVRAEFLLDKGKLLFYDPRRFGTFDLISDQADALPAGVDPFDRKLTAASFAQMLSSSPQALKLWLLRQDRLVGLGNIYASEILHDCGLHPERCASSLDSTQAAELLASTRGILRKAIRHCGTTFSDFHNVNGEAGGFSRFLQVYGRAGQSCLRCGTPVERIVQGQRSTFFCPACQPQWSKAGG